MLDEKRPYSMAWGIGGAQKYIQDGVEYAPDKKTVLVKEAGKAEENPESAADDGRQHWRNLKAQVEAKGGIWTDSQAAIEFLKLN
jgi:hypothetical protein